MKRICMDFSPMSVRTAFLEEDRLAEIYIDSYSRRSVVGNIYKARIENVIKGQFAFLNIAERKNGFLQLNDFKQRGIEGIKLSIGTDIMVQALRDETEEKGAYLSCELSLSGRFCVLIKSLEEDGEIKISKKIEDIQKRQKLKDICDSHCPKGYGIIMRTECASAKTDEIICEIEYLHGEFKKILNQGGFAKAPSKIYAEENPYEDALKKLFVYKPDCIIINSEKELENVKKIVSDYGMDSLNVEVYGGSIGLFEVFGIESQMEKALREKVWLKCGGFIIIEQTKTCAFIDVNTGKFVNKKNIDQTIFKTNIEAACEIAAQIRLRNLSGVIIVDFVNIKDSHKKTELLEAFSAELKKDNNPAVIVDYGGLGMVQLTRKKSRSPLIYSLTKACSSCGGSGRSFNDEYIAENIFRDAIRMLKNTIYDKITIEARENIISLLKLKQIDKALGQINNGDIVFKVNKYAKEDYFQINGEKNKM